jgi:hypothetical protein
MTPRTHLTLVLLAVWNWPAGGSQAPPQADSAVKRWAAPAERLSAGDRKLYHLRADDRAIYWVSCAAPDDPCTLHRLAHGAAAPESVATLASASGLRAYALDTNDVFFADGDRILRVPKRGGSPARVATVTGPVFELAVAGDSLYASTADTRDMTGRNLTARPGTLLRIPKIGGSAVELGEHNSPLPRMAIDRRTVFFTGRGTILSMPIGGGPLSVLARDDSYPPSSIAIDGDSVYYTAAGEVRRVAKAGGRVDVLYRAQIVLDVRAAGGAIYAARNVAYDRGTIAQTAALVRMPSPGGEPAVLAELTDSPQSIAVDRSGIFVILQARAATGQAPDRIMAFPAQ